MTVSTTPTQQKQSSADTEYIVMRSGPHDDLATLCLYLNDVERVDQSDQQSKLAFIADTAEQMLEAESREERLGAAREILKEQSDCSIANAVMAREGSKSEDEIERYYQLAISALKQECTRHEALIDNHFDNCDHFDEESNSEHDLSDVKEAYLLEHEAHFIVVAEFAQYLWQQKKFDQAIAIMLDVADLISQLRPENGYIFISEGKLITITISWLILQNRNEDARKLLRKPDNSSDWLHFNALMRYRTEGDTTVSRAALHHAISVESSIFRQLANSANFQSTAEDTEVEQLTSDYYFNILKKAWASSHGALEWMGVCDKAFQKRLPVFEDYECASSNPERVERWQNHLLLGRKFVERSDYREAKKHLKTALKEATAIKDDNMAFLITFALVTLRFNTINMSVEELLEPIERKLVFLLEDLAPATQVKANLFSLFGGVFKGLGTHDRAADLFKLSIEQLEELQGIDGNSVDLYDTSKALYGLGFSLAKQSLHTEALRWFEQALTQKEQYLCIDHPLLLDTLEGVFRALHHLGRHEEKELIRDRLHKIGYNINYGNHSSHGPACPWSLKELSDDFCHSEAD